MYVAATEFTDGPGTLVALRGDEGLEGPPLSGCGEETLEHLNIGRITASLSKSTGMNYHNFLSFQSN